MFLVRCIFPIISSQLEGALLKDALKRGGGSGACGRGGRASRTREASGFRPGPLRGSATDVAGRGQACGAKSLRVAASPEERTEVLKNAAAGRREALPCASVSRRSGK